jgi:hypothetical protein
MTMKSPSLACVLFVTTVLVAACAPAPPPPDPGVENLDLGIRLSGVPESLVVATNQESKLELRPAGETAEGKLWFSVTPEDQGENLVEAVKMHQGRIEGLPEGDYKGAQELQGPLGTAFYSRGRFLEGGTLVEETVLVTIHPTESRALEITYRYPAADDSAARVEQLIDVLAHLEGIPPGT